MRLLLQALLLISLLPAFCFGAEPPTDEAPIPQDPAAQKKHRQALRETERRLFVGAYDHFGKKDPRWDDSARASLDATARFLRDWEFCGDASLEALEAAEKAIAAGCDDPLVRYVAAWTKSTLYSNRLRRADLHVLLVNGGTALHQSKYPAFLRMLGARHTAEGYALLSSLPKILQDKVGDLMGSVWDLGIEALKDDDPIARDIVIDIMAGNHAAYRKGYYDRSTGFAKAEKALTAAKADKALLLRLKGVFLVRWAWDARGDDVAINVTPEGWKLFGQRLEQADEALRESWKLDPSSELTARMMMVICKGRGLQREEMESWFDKAMRADGDSGAACREKLDYLEPKWNGSAEAMVAFGRQCLKTGNWEAGLPFVLAKAHVNLSRDRDYLRREGVWDDLKAVYEPYLKQNPGSIRLRTAFARLAFLAGKFEEADRQFGLLKGKYWPTMYESDTAYKKMVEDASNTAAIHKLLPDEK
jgi:hypothetical protein